MSSASDFSQPSFLSATVMASENNSPELASDVWTHEEIDATRWNQVFPYQLQVVKVGADGTYFQDKLAKSFQFTLPFPPDAISYSQVFPVTGSVTQGGYVEEWGDDAIRQISWRGSLGVLPLRPRPAGDGQNAGLGTAVFGGTVITGTRTINQAQMALGYTENVLTENEAAQTSTGIGSTSGYYQLRLLEQFFENYVALRAGAQGRDYRLVACMWKRQAAYLVTPMSFTADQTAASPLEYTYSLAFQAFRRIKLSSVRPLPFPKFKPVAQDPNAMAKALNAISAARDALEGLRATIQAVGGDIDQALFEPLRQVGLFVRDAINVPLSLIDLPVQILNEARSAVTQYAATKTAVLGAPSTFSAAGARVGKAYQDLADYATSTAKLEAGAARVEGIQDATAHPALDIFKNPKDYYDFLKTVQVGSLQLAPATTRAVVAERERVRQLTRLDFERLRDQVVRLQADFSDAVGAGSAVYNATYGRPAPTSTKTPTPRDFQAIYAMNRVVMEFNRLAASTHTVAAPPTTMDYVAGLAARSGIAFTVPRSKFAVPFPYGHTLEQVAARYLGDPDRWMEIAALNGLRAPYVDEAGFYLPLQVNGKGQDLVVADGSGLFVGQRIWLSSQTAARTTRRVTAVREVAPGTVRVTVDGDPVDAYLVLAGAAVHAFLPDTVNSQQVVYLPSDSDPGTADYGAKAIPGLNEFDLLLEVGGQDLLLTSTNDLVITPDGDQRLAVGLQNIVQDARLALGTVQGKLPRHPGYGLPLQIGQSLADLDAAAILKAAKNLFLDQPAFNGLVSADVVTNGPTTQVALTLNIRGLSQPVPVTLAVSR